MKNPRAFEQLFCSSVVVKSLITLLFPFSLMIPLAASSIDSGGVKIAWDANHETNVIGYRVHYGTKSGAYTNVIDIGSATQFVIPGLIKGQSYFCSVTAYNTYGIESDFAQELMVIHSPTVSSPRSAEQEFRIDRMVFGADHLMTFEVSGMTGNTVEVWASPDLAAWTHIGTLTGVSGPISIKDTAAQGQPRRFYQLRTR
jgi:hypothetical protein